jgi:hypothetical protein
VSFLISHYYLVEPTPQLVERVRAVLDADFASVILERVVVAKRHIALHGDDANAVALKLAFLSLLRIDRIWDTPTQFEEVFGSATLAPELFDRWWTLTEVEFALFEDWEPFVGQAVPFIRPQTDSRVAGWLLEQQRRAEPDSAPDPSS